MPRLPSATLSAVLLTSSLATASCGPKPLAVHPVQPLPPPKVEVPEFLKQAPEMPSWLRPTTSASAPTTRSS